MDQKLRSNKKEKILCIMNFSSDNSPSVNQNFNCSSIYFLLVLYSLTELVHKQGSKVYHHRFN